MTEKKKKRRPSRQRDDRKRGPSCQRDDKLRDELQEQVAEPKRLAVASNGRLGD